MTILMFSEQHVADIPFDKMDVAAGKAIPVFSERHVAAISFDKTKLCVRAGGAGYSNPCVFWSVVVIV